MSHRDACVRRRSASGASLFALLLMLAPVSDAEPGRVLWSAPLSGPVFASPALAEDGTVYAQGARLHALSPAGVELWQRQAAGSLGCTHARADAVLVTACDDLITTGNDGTPRWRFTVPEWAHNPPAVGADGRIYFGARHLRAVAPSGQVLWTHETPERVNTPTTLGRDATVYASAGGTLLAVSRAGTSKWRFEGGRVAEGEPVIDATGHVLIAIDATLYRLDPRGRETWRHEAEARFTSSPVIGPGGTIYIGNRDGHLHAIEPGHGLRWRFRTGGDVASTPAIGAAGVLYVGSNDGNVYAVDVEGQERWRVATGGAVISSPVVSPDGTVYVGSSDGRLHAIESVSPGLADGAWPMYRHDPARTGRSHVQVPPAGDLEGEILEEASGQPSRAIVALIGETGVRWALASATTGRYAVLDVAVGEHRLVVFRLGYRTQVRVVDVRDGEIRTQDVALVAWR